MTHNIEENELKGLATKLAEHGYGQPKRLAKGEELYGCDDSASSINMIVKGLVLRTVFPPAGVNDEEELILGAHGPGEILGLRAHCSGPTSKYLETAVVSGKAPADIVVLPAAILSSPGFLRSQEGREVHRLIREQVDYQLRNAAEREVIMRHGGARHKMQHVLADLAERLGTRVDGRVVLDLGLSREDLANLACIRQETVSREIRSMEQEGLIACLKQGGLAIPNIAKLHQYASDK